LAISRLVVFLPKIALILIIHRPRFFFIAGLAKLFLLLVVGLALGSELFPFGEVWKALYSNENKTLSYIVWEIRMPHLLTAVLAGAALSTSGLLMQTYFRNALAGPYILGVSAGSGLGVALYTMLGSLLGLQLVSFDMGMVLSSAIGAFSILLLIAGVSRYIGSGTMLLITGLMLGSFVSALVGLLQYFSAGEAIKKYILWSLGSLNALTLKEVGGLALIIASLLTATLFRIRALNALLLGELEAQSLGIRIQREKLLILLIAGGLAAVITVYCGPIAFIGLAAPHVARIILPTANHRILLPAAALTGAVVLLFCDIIAQWPGSSIQLPINAITSIIGAPIVIYIILRHRNFQYE
jgi:iron complex transport system permease protein